MGPTILAGIRLGFVAMDMPIALARGLAARPGWRPAARGYRIRIKDLTLLCHIGVYPHEKDHPQRVRINVDLTVRESVTPLDDNIDNVVPYDLVIERIKALAEGRHINLLESLADAIAEVCLADARVESVRLSVAKLDVFPDTDGVGVDIERFRSDG